MLQQSLKQPKDINLIKKAIDSMQAKRQQRQKQKSFDQHSSNISTEIDKNRFEVIRLPDNDEMKTERRKNNHLLRIKINQQANDMSCNQYRYRPLELLQQSHKSANPQSAQSKKKNALYLRKNKDSDKVLTLAPIKTEQVWEKSIVDKKKVFYLSIKRSPLQRYDSKSQNMYYMPDFNEKQQKSGGSQASCTMRYLNQCLSKSENKPTRLNISIPSHQFDTIKSVNSIIPAFPQPAPIKYKKMKQKQENVFQKIHDYIVTKRVKEQLQRSLIIESKKQEIIKNNIKRHQKPTQLRRKNIFKTSIEKKNHSQSSEKLKQKSEAIKKQLNNRMIIKNAELISPRQNKGEKKIQKQFEDFLNNKQKLTIYDQKIMSYRQLIFLVNMAHRVFNPLILVDPLLMQKSQKMILPRYKYYIGSGNNSKLIRALMKRRPWWQQSFDVKEADFVWTQIKLSSVFSAQKISLINYQSQIVQENIQVVSIQDKRQSIKQLSERHGCPKEYVFKPPFLSTGCSKILTPHAAALYNSFLNFSSQNEFDQFQLRIKHFPQSYFRNQKCNEGLMHNHLQFNHCLGNKKSLFYHLTLYYKIVGKSISTAIPQTFHIKSLHNDPSYSQFLSQFNCLSKNKGIQNIWIVKPGQNSNRGSGIDVFNDIRRLKFLIRDEKYKDGQSKTYIIQKYIERPLLYQGRKFDIRHYLIITMLYGQLRAYWYGQGYIRTSSYKFDLLQLEDSMIHLTNDAIQKQSKDYGTHQEANKISYIDLQRYFDKNHPCRHFDFKKIFQKMRDLAKDTVCSTYLSLSQSKKVHNFEIFGLDFMIDDHLKVHLIQINTNPCLQLSSGLLGRIIPLMVEQTFRISLDAIFPPNMHYSNNCKSLAPDCSLEKLQLELIFDEALEKQYLERLYANHQAQYKEMMSNLTGNENDDDQTFDNEGEDVEIDNLIT